MIPRSMVCIYNLEYEGLCHYKHVEHSVCLELLDITPFKLLLHHCYVGEANVLQDFEITEGKKKVHVAGCRCAKGILKKTGKYRLHRGQEVLYDG
jgi:hypothetical protein